MPSYLEMASRVRAKSSNRSGHNSLSAEAPWDENEAFDLIRAARHRLNEHFVKHRQCPWYDSALDAACAALTGPVHDDVKEAYAREDMAALRVAVRTYMEVGMAAFKRASPL
jgi:hypothetical protein